MSLPPTDPYQVLGVPITAKAAEIKAAYRALVKQHHPDAGGDEHRILELNAAWEGLGDAQRRADHDRRHPASVAAGPGHAVEVGRAARRSANCTS